MEHARPIPDRENDLLDRARGGDAAAFCEIVRAHERVVYGIARRLLGSHEAADDAAQETFVRAWRSLKAFRGESALRTWLVRIVLNVARSPAGGSEAREVPITGIPDPADHEPSASDRLEREETRRKVREAVAALPRRQREVVTLKVFAEMTHAEVAFVLQITEGAAKAHLHQAVSNLRRSLVSSRSLDRPEG